MTGMLVFLIILIILLIGGYGGWVLWSRMQATKNGLPPPSLNPFARNASASNYPGPAPAGIRGWIDSQIRKFKNRNNRYATGAYEEPSTYAGGRTGRGEGNRLDPDEAWDSRVGNEAYYEEQELGLHAPQHGGGASANPYESTSYGAPTTGFAAEPERGRSRTREYDEHSDGRSGRDNPFGDENAASLRGVSPRPLDHGVDTSYGGASKSQGHKKTGSGDNSPTGSRRSIFHENM
ncbi:hypothetical protein BU26DRAFT_543067 [Trematosphaeria pertusa]|uniref:Acid phosphatase-like protein n=1 Tax=Trematosphaeria pertusa TaxID=390896 RepID=A0A6A6I270_9PLEO|nr:uncharacterized protein BU26DRAFT_543067 [Trematosphaeria pertusa]KAF2244431.1 hypothetical protein BU26DRAFT_543067 [Trematosphaeria pertusa]